MILHLYLVIRHQRALEQIYLIEKDETMIGRSPNSVFCLMDPHVSRQHLKIIRTAVGFLARDLGSRNGTRLNGKPLTEAILCTADHLELGPFSLKAFHDFAEAKADSETEEVSTVLDYRSIVADEIRESLTPRQQRVYDHFLLGQSEKEIALALDLSVNTIHTHARAIYSIFAVSSRSELLARCVPQRR
ncbi:MAG: FHA domain-containing protein [Planctomycetota bacterium]